MDVSVADFLQEQVGPAGARTVLKSAFEGIFCRRAEEVSMDLALYAIGRSGGFAHMQGVQGGAQERQLTDGAGLIAERLAAELGDSVRLRSAVRRVDQGKAGVMVRTETERFLARQLVIAIPPPLIAQLEFDPPLNSQRWDVLRTGKMGHVIKYNLVYPNPFWKRSGLSGAIWSTTGPVNVCYDTTPVGTEFGVLSALSVAQTAEDLCILPPEQRKARVIEGISAHLGAAALEPREYLDMVWADEPFTGGGYSVTLPPGGFSLGPSAFRDSEGPIHFAGTETASEYPGYMEGAVESGQRAAEDVLRRL
jgi:monoamine oxidase